MVFLRYISAELLLSSLLFLISCSKIQDDSEIFKFAKNCPILEIIDSLPDSPFVKYVSFRYENNICTGFDYKTCYTDTLLISYDFIYSHELITAIKEINRSDPARKQWDSVIYTINKINNDEIHMHSKIYGTLDALETELQFSGTRIIETSEHSNLILYLDKSKNIVKEEYFTGGNAIPYITRLYVYDKNPSPLYNLPFEAKMAGMHNLLGFLGSSGWTNNVIQCTNSIADEKNVFNYNLEYNDNEYPVKNHSKFGTLSYYYGNCY